MTDKTKKMEKTSDIFSINNILRSLTTAGAAALAYLNLSSYYLATSKKYEGMMPFGEAGVGPYYYQSVELYATVKLVWGLMFLGIFLYALWASVKKKEINYKRLFGITAGLIVLHFIHGRIG